MNDRQYLAHQAKRLFLEAKETTDPEKLLVRYAAIISLLLQLERDANETAKARIDNIRLLVNRYFGFEETVEGEDPSACVGEIRGELDTLKFDL